MEVVELRPRTNARHATTHTTIEAAAAARRPATTMPISSPDSPEAAAGEDGGGHAPPQYLQLAPMNSVDPLAFAQTPPST